MKDKEHHTETHCRLILKHLSSGKHITQMEALKKFGCMRLGARIFDLKKQGHNIKTVLVSKNNKRFAKYQLVNYPPTAEPMGWASGVNTPRNRGSSS